MKLTILLIICFVCPHLLTGNSIYSCSPDAIIGDTTHIKHNLVWFYPIDIVAEEIRIGYEHSLTPNSSVLIDGFYSNGVAYGLHSVGSHISYKKYTKDHRAYIGPELLLKKSFDFEVDKITGYTQNAPSWFGPDSTPIYQTTFVNPWIIALSLKGGVQRRIYKHGTIEYYAGAGLRYKSLADDSNTLNISFSPPRYRKNMIYPNFIGGISISLF